METLAWNCLANIFNYLFCWRCKANCISQLYHKCPHSFSRNFSESSPRSYDWWLYITLKTIKTSLSNKTIPLLLVSGHEQVISFRAIMMYLVHSPYNVTSTCSNRWKWCFPKSICSILVEQPFRIYRKDHERDTFVILI